MKSLYLSFAGLILITACNQGPKHPQSSLSGLQSVAAMTAPEILQYADSIDAHTQNLENINSLVYDLPADTKMYVEQYHENGKPILYVEHLDIDGLRDVVSRYYLKNDSLIFISSLQKATDANPAFTARRTYLRNNIIFKTEQKSGVDTAALNKQAYLNKKPEGTNAYKDKLLTFQEALNGKSKFEMIFDKVLSLPDARYLLLKGKIPTGYAASVLVVEPDALIDSLERDPLHFRDKALNFNWEIRGREAVYVPVAASVTSAKGLNK
jgi:hypothetical protein